MGNKLLYQDHRCRLSVGMFGGMRVEIAGWGSKKIARDRVRYLKQILKHYRSLGGRSDPADKELASLFEQFLYASVSDTDTPLFEEFFGETPQSHAAQVISFRIENRALDLQRRPGLQPTIANKPLRAGRIIAASRSRKETKLAERDEDFLNARVARH